MHWHPYQAELFEVLDGHLTVEMADTPIHILEPRSIVDIPARTPHRMWNAGSAVARATWRITPPRRSEEMFRHPSYHPAPPTLGSMPKQEPGTRPARAIGYDLTVTERPTGGAVTIDVDNSGDLGVHLQARMIEPSAQPHSYTVGAGDRLSASWPVAGEYDVHLHGPNGFFRQYAGHAAGDRVRAAVSRVGSTRQLRIEVHSPRDVVVTIDNAYGSRLEAVPGRQTFIDTAARSGWYDLTLTVEGTTWLRAFAGHLEDGHGSVSEPALGR